MRTGRCATLIYQGVELFTTRPLCNNIQLMTLKKCSTSFRLQLSSCRHYHLPRSTMQEHVSIVDIPDEAWEPILQYMLKERWYTEIAAIRSTSRQLRGASKLVFGRCWVRFWMDNRQDIIADMNAALRCGDGTIMATVLQHPLVVQHREEYPKSFKARMDRYLNTSRNIEIGMIRALIEVGGARPTSPFVRKAIRLDDAQVVMYLSTWCVTR